MRVEQKHKGERHTFLGRLEWRIWLSVQKQKLVFQSSLGNRTHSKFILKAISSEQISLCYHFLELGSSSIGRHGLERDAARGQVAANTASNPKILGNLVSRIDRYPDLEN
jgi:hypothetical protein